MKLDHCEYDLETNFVEPCSDCRVTKFQRKYPIKLGAFVLYVTYLYEIRNCLQGFTAGDFVNAMSLLPGEEQEVEIVQKSKYERALHQQQSIESHFESEMMNTMRAQASTSFDVNTSVSGEAGVDLGIFEVGGGASVSTASHFASSFFNEVVQKASQSVSRHYEVSIDTKTEIENKYRSLRRIFNPNKCRVVTYFFKQLSKKYSIDVVFTGVRFDLIRHLPDIHNKLLPYHTVATRFATDVNQPNTVANFNPARLQVDAAAPVGAFRSFSAALSPQLHTQVQDAFQTQIFRDITLAKELSAAALVDKLDSLKVEKNDRALVLEAVKELDGRKENQPGFVLYHGEYCVRTNSIVAEPKVSNCSICACEECNSAGGPSKCKECTGGVPVSPTA